MHLLGAITRGVDFERSQENVRLVTFGEVDEVVAGRIGELAD